MSTHLPKQSYRSKLFQQDIVQKISAPDYFGVVLRCWYDAEDVPTSPSFSDPLMRPLAYGEVGVTFISHGSLRQILPESDLRLVDRTLQVGDYCKRSVDDVRSGVVTNATIKGHLAHAISAVPVDGWRIVNDLEDKADADIGDYVTYDDWIGQIIEVFDEAIVQVSSGQLVRLPELGSRLNVGDSGSSILSPVPSTVQKGSSKDTVIAVKHNAYAVVWLALNQFLERTIAEKKSRPQKFWSGEELGMLTLIRGRFDLDMRVGDRVHLKDTTGLPMTEHGQVGDATGAFQVTTCLVTETSTEVDILWQDGVQETIKSTDLIPYLNPDEYDCWPGDHVVWKTEGLKRPAIVQSVDAIQRTALILFPDTGTVELASLLELDPHGNSDLDANVSQAGPEASFGVRRGDFVFIHSPETTNGLEPPRVPRIGEIEAWIRENPFQNGQFVGWRKELQKLGSRIASQRSTGTLVEKRFQMSTNAESKLSWCGEVSGLNLDGTVEVTRFDWIVANYPLERLTRLYDGIEQLEDEWDESASEGDRSFSDEGERPWIMETDGTWRPEQADAGNEWEPVHDGMDIDEDVDSFQRDDTVQRDETLIWPEQVSNFRTLETILIPKIKPEYMEGLDTGQGLRDESCSPLEECEVSTMLESVDFQDDHDVWNRFEISATAPPDHAFFSSSPDRPSKSFLGRLRREYHILATSLPDNILVRAYEDRTDLLRSLIIGPENTPYEDAPFVIDWMLDSNFPHSPPVAHFLSWTNGNGRVNPNLYEEGKVCLSILGTWTGDKNETWSAARSSLLQAFVSIQGLVLVKEPWFCEPAYEKLRGTEEGTVNSRLYSEKAYVLSRGFVRRALEIPLGGLENEIAHLFYGKRRLHKVVQDAQRLIQKSRESLEVTLEDQDIAVPRLTAGGIIALERTLNRLCGWLDRCPS